MIDLSGFSKFVCFPRYWENFSIFQKFSLWIYSIFCQNAVQATFLVNRSNEHTIFPPEWDVADIYIKGDYSNFELMKISTFFFIGMFDAESWMLILWIKKEQNHEWNVINCRIIGINFIVSQQSITCGPPCWFCVLKSKDCVFLSVHSDFENNKPKLNINVRRTVGVLQFIFGVRFHFMF